MPPGRRAGVKLFSNMATSIESSPPPPSAEPVPGQEPHDAASRRRTAFWITLAAVVLLIGGWVYLLFFYDPGLMIDELADRKFPTQGEQVCAAAVAQLDQLPTANLAPDANDRADTVARSNVILHTMVDQMRPLVPTGPPKVTKGVTEWLDDWNTYIFNREEYVSNLRKDPEARFLESTKRTSTKGITRAINGFAEVNEMSSCVTPADLS